MSPIAVSKIALSLFIALVSGPIAVLEYRWVFNGGPSKSCILVISRRADERSMGRPDE